MPDPIELLESFPRSLAGATPPPGDLRQRGDRRRTRHRAAGMVAVMAVLAAVITPFALRDDDSRSDGGVVTPPDVPKSITGTIPNGFDIRQSLPVTSATGAWHWDDIALEACGRSLPDSIGRQRPAALPVPLDIRRDGTRYEGATYEREVMVFTDAATAQSWSDAVVAFYGSCLSEDVNGVERTHQVTAEPTEAGSFVSVLTNDEMDGSTSHRVQLNQVYVVGAALFFTQFLDETSTGEDDPSTEEAERARPVVAAMGHSWVSFPDEPMITSSSEAAAKLPGASIAFQEFVGSLADELAAGADCPDAAVGVTVHYIVDDRWALGAVNQCGGYIALWGRADDGTWHELIGTQEMWACADLTRHEIPEGIVGPCYPQA